MVDLYIVWSAIVGGQEEDLSFNVPTVLTRCWDIFDSMDFTCLGSTTWESLRMAAPAGDREALTVTPRENGASAGGGTPSSDGDGTAMPQWRGRTSGGRRRDRTTRTPPLWTPPPWTPPPRPPRRRVKMDRARCISAHHDGTVSPPRSIADVAWMGQSPRLVRSPMRLGLRLGLRCCV
jgi:hypothetical protein